MIGSLDGSLMSDLLGADHWDCLDGQGDVLSGLSVSNSDIDEITEGDRCRFRPMELLKILPELSCDWVCEGIIETVVPSSRGENSSRLICSSPLRSSCSSNFCKSMDESVAISRERMMESSLLRGIVDMKMHQ